MKRIHALALAAVFAAEAVLFGLMTSRHCAWIYPRWFDQLQYLGQAYDGYEYMRQHGFAGAAWHTLTQHSAQGSLHAFFALVVFAVAGPSRGAALAVNLLAFLALQAATFLAVRRISRSYPIAWAAVALLASMRSPWAGGPASAVDFRLDWIAACSYGVALAAALAGDGFRSTRRAAVFGVAVGVVILIRHLTAVYFALIFLALMGWLLTRPNRGARCVRLLLAAAVTAGISAPELWLNRRAIYGYYWFDQLVSAERGLRESHLGVVASVGWLLREVVIYQVGLGAAILGVGATCALLVLRLKGNAPREGSGPQQSAAGDSWAVALAFLCAPAVIPLFHPIKAAQTLSMLIPGATWMVVLVWLHAARGVGRGAIAAVCGIVVAAGALLFVRAEVSQDESAEKTAQFRRINGLDDYLYFRAEESGLERPRVAVTWLLDALNAKAVQIVGFERHRRLLPFFQTLPADLYATTREFVTDRLAMSDFVCLVTRAGATYPFDHQMEGQLPETRRWCEAHMTHVGDLDTVEFSVSVYERPDLARPAAGGVVLARMLEAAARGPADGEPAPPGAPVFVSASRALGSTQAPFRCALAAAYSPIAYAAEGLPEGLSFEPGTGEITGRIARAGDYAATIRATNSAGSTRATLALHIEEARMYALVEAPAACAAGAPVDIRYGAFDADGRLDFVDFTDLTTGRSLDRIPAPPGAKRSWEGTFRTVFVAPGEHAILLRAVCFNPEATPRYSFVDRPCVIRVAP